MTRKLGDLATPALVAFDLDGTLLDSRGDIVAACNHVLAWSGRATLPDATIASFVGDGARSLLARAFDVPSDAPELDAVVAEWRRFYVAHPIDRSTWMPGAEDALDAARSRTIAIALVTNKARAVTERILDALGITDRFAVIYAGGDGALKPSAEPMRVVANAVGVEVRDAWLVGDADQDVGAARAAGCTSIAVLGGFQSAERVLAARPDVVVESLRELAERLG